jgi:integrase
VSNFGARELKLWQHSLCELKNDKGELRLTRSTIMQMEKMVWLLYEWGFVEGRVDQLDAAASTLVKPPQRGKVKESVKLKGVARSLIDAALPHLTPPLQAAIELLWLTCARPSEILGLKVKDIIRGGTVLTDSAIELDLMKMNVWAAIKRDHKTDDTDFDRVIFFGPKSAEDPRSPAEGLGWRRPRRSEACWRKRRYRAGEALRELDCPADRPRWEAHPG